MGESGAAARSRSVGILGFGDFGRFLAEQLRRHAPTLRLHTWDIDECPERRRAAAELNATWATASACAACDVVVPAVPVQHLEPLMRHVAPSLRPGALWIDVASVKVRPVELMLQLLPLSTRLVATHPMFGPQSGRNGIAGLRVAYWPVRGDALHLRRFLEKTLGLEVIERSPERHDREMAYIQGLTHWVARALREIKMPDLELATPAYRHLLSIEEILRQDSDALFLTIQRENSFTSAARRQFTHRLDELEAWITDESTDHEPRSSSLD